MTLRSRAITVPCRGSALNPTNNLNPDDLRDPLLFGKQAGNFMVKADYYITKPFKSVKVLEVIEERLHDVTVTDELLVAFLKKFL